MADGSFDTNDNGTAKRSDVSRSLKLAAHYLTASGNAFAADAFSAGHGDGEISQYDVNVRKRVRDLSLSNAG